METLQNKKRILSKQLDAQIQKFSQIHHTLKSSEDNISPFQVLERRLKILQQKLNKAHQSQYQPVHQKLYSLSSNKKYEACKFFNDSDEQIYQKQKQIKQIEPNDNQRQSQKQGSNIIQKSEGKEYNHNHLFKNSYSNKKNDSSTKRKAIRAKSQGFESGQVTHKNSKVVTPQKKKKVIMSHIQFDDNSHKYYANLHKNEIDDNSHTEQKMKPRNLSSNKKSQTKSTKKWKKSVIKKKFVEQEDNQGKHRSYKILDHHILSYSHEPLIPLRQKINLERQLKQYSKQNIKLKGQIGQLKKYEQQYWKMKEIFNKFEKHRLKSQKLNSTQK